MSDSRKKVLAIGARPFPKRENVDLLSVSGIKKFWVDVGGNSGNCIIGELGRQGIDCDYENVRGQFDLSSKEPSLSNDYERVVIFAANWLNDDNLNFDYTKYIDWYDKCDVGITILGMGCQTKAGELQTKEERQNFVKAFSPSYIKLLSIIGEKGGISTRDEITTDILRIAGVKNVVATGCPTWFCNGYNQIPVVKKNFNEIHNVSFSLGVIRGAACQKILSLGSGFDDYSAVIQSERMITPFVSRRLKSTDAMFCKAKRLPSFVKKYYKITQSNLNSNWGVLFSDLNSWKSFLSSRDFNFGCRIHNTILGMKIGVPSIIIKHDIRTKLMAEFFQIPSISLSEFISESFSLEKVYENADFDLMNKRYSLLLENYVSFLASQNLKLNSNCINHINWLSTMLPLGEKAGNCGLIDVYKSMRIGRNKKTNLVGAISQFLHK